MRSAGQPGDLGGPVTRGDGSMDSAPVGASGHACTSRCRRRGAAGEPVGAVNRRVEGDARTWWHARGKAAMAWCCVAWFRSYAHPSQNELQASMTWSCVARICSPAPGPLVLHLLIKMETATEVGACGQSHRERGAGLVRVLIGSHPWRWARGIVQGEADMSTGRASGEWRHRKVA